jgi:hypothetical protein
MLAHIPGCDLPRLFMTGETFCGPGISIDFFAEVENIHPATTAFFDMLCTGPMTGFAGILGFRPFHRLFGMNGPGIGCILGFMATLTGFRADISFFIIRSWYFLFTAEGQGDREHEKEKRE